MRRKSSVASIFFAFGLSLVLPDYWPVLSRSMLERLATGSVARTAIPAQVTQYEFVEHVIDQVRSCEGNPLVVTRNTSQATYDFTFSSGTEAGCTAVTIPNGQITLGFPSVFTSGVAFTPTINTTGTLQLRVAANHFSVSGRGLTVDTVLNRLPKREDAGVHQDLRNAPCPLARFRQNPPLNGGTEAVPGLNPFSRSASCAVTAPALFQSFEGNMVLLISTIDIVVGQDPIGPADFFDYRGIRLLRFTITSKYRPASNSCPALALQNGFGAQQQICTISIDAPTKVSSSDDCPVEVTARKADGTPDTSFNGMVMVSLVGSTPNIGCLRSGAQCAESLSLPMKDGVLKLALQTPLLSPSTKVLDANSVLDLRNTVLEGTARITAQIGSIAAAPKVVNVESPLDLKIKSVEVQQGVKQGNAGLWIGERDLLVRVYLEANRTGPDKFDKYSVIHGITANLFVKDKTGSEIIDSPFLIRRGAINSGAEYVFMPNAAATADGSDSLNYVLSGTFEAQLNLEVKLDDKIQDRNKANNSAPYDGPLNFLHSKPITFLYTKLRILDGADKTEFPTQAGIDLEMEFIKQAWPAGPRSLKFVERPDEVQTTVILAGGDPFTFRTRLLGIGYWLSAARGLRYVYFVDRDYFSVIRESDPNIPLINHPGIGTDGYTSGAINLSVVNSNRCGQSRFKCGTLAHELGHQMGFEDTYVLPNKLGNPVGEGSFSWFHREFTPGKLDNFGTPTHTYLDFMGNGGDDYQRTKNWTDLSEWNYLKSKLPFTPETGKAQQAQQSAIGSYVIVQGQVNKNGTASFDACYTLSLDDPQNAATGRDYVIETLDANSAVLNSLSFAPDFRLLHLQQDRQQSEFNFALPFSSAVRQIKLRSGGAVLASRAVSANAPTASFVSNFSGLTLTGTQQVSWTGSDADGGVLTYYLFYSPDGQLRMPLIDTTTTTYAWKTDDYPSGPSPMLTLVANDGVNATVMDSQPFKLPNRPPRITIQTPGDQSQFKVGESIALVGSLFDPEEDLNLNPQLQWTSGISGALGTGKALTVSNLQAGTHVITASGTDSQGSGGTDSVTIVVRPDNFSKIEATPASVDFGNNDVGQPKDLRLSVRNSGNTPFTVNALTVNNAQFRVIAPAAPFAVAERSQQEVTVRFTPSSAVLQTGAMTITSNASNQTALNVALLGAATGPSAGGFATVSAASYSTAPLAREAIVAGFGVSLAGSIESAASVPLPTQLAGTTVKVKDSTGRQYLAPLFFVSPAQINYQIPPDTADGPATIIVTSGSGALSIGTVTIVVVSPGVFTANSDGTGVPAAFAIRLKADSTQISEPVAKFDQAQNKFVPAPIDFGPPDDQIVLVLFGTGLRYRSSLAALTCTIGGTAAEVGYAGPQGSFVGLDQINIGVPRSLADRGEVDLILTVDGQPNTVRVAFGKLPPVCSYSIAPLSQNFPASGGIGGVSVTAPTGCAWTAASNAAWLAITAGSQGSGAGTASYFVAANSLASQRAGTLTIAGQTFTVTQAAAASPVTILAHLTSGGPIPNDCAPPTIKNAFLTTDAVAYHWTLAIGAHAGDQVRWEFAPVNGGFLQTAQFAVQTEGSVCFWSALNIGGTPVASLPGNWQVRVFYNNVLLFTDNLTISQP